MSDVAIERSRRVRPPKSAAAEIMPETHNFVESAQSPPANGEDRFPQPKKFMEVKLNHKYVPHLCYELDVATGKYSAVKDDDGKYIYQSNVKIGDGLDRFGRRVDVFRQILDWIPAGTVIDLPEHEAMRALKLGVAQFTDGTM